MCIHLGNGISVSMKSIIGIFDIENSSTDEITRNFLRYAEKNQKVITVSYNMPKSFIVCTDSKNKIIVYISCISVSALKKRCRNENWRI